MANPLTRDEHRHRTMELELDHLGRRRVAMATQVPNEAASLRDLASAGAITDSRGLLDSLVRYHCVYIEIGKSIRAISRATSSSSIQVYASLAPARRLSQRSTAC